MKKTIMLLSLAVAAQTGFSRFKELKEKVYGNRGSGGGSSAFGKGFRNEA